MKEKTTVTGEMKVGGWENHRKIRINNFRSLKMDDFIDIKKITLLFGKNGAGKSSFIKAIKFLGHNLFPAQTGQTIYNLENNIDLGDFKQIVYRNEVDNKIIIDFEEYWENFEESNGLRKSNIINYSVNTLIEDNEDGKNISSIKITDLINQYDFTIYPRDKNNYDENIIKNIGDRVLSAEEIKLLMEKSMLDNSVGYSGYPGKSLEINRNFRTNKKEFEKFIKYLDVLPFINTKEDFRYSYFNELADFIGHSDEQRKFIEFLMTRFIKEIPTLMKKFFNHWYVTPVREKPGSYIRLIGNKFNPKEYYGIPNQVDLSIQRYNKYYPGNDLGDIVYFINNELSKLGLGREILINKDKGFGQVLIKDNFGVIHNLAESSSGIIQILPIIVSSHNALYTYEDYVIFFEDESSTDVIIIEQPELHLHPALQTKIVEFIKDAKSTFVIETHSEHIIRKLQVLIAQGKLRKEEVAVYYFDKDPKSGITSIKEMELEQNGFFKEPWPDGFFDDSFNLSMELLTAKKN